MARDLIREDEHQSLMNALRIFLLHLLSNSLSFVDSLFSHFLLVTFSIFPRSTFLPLVPLLSIFLFSPFLPVASTDSSGCCGRRKARQTSAKRSYGRTLALRVWQPREHGTSSRFIPALQTRNSRREIQRGKGILLGLQTSKLRPRASFMRSNKKEASVVARERKSKYYICKHILELARKGKSRK